MKAILLLTVLLSGTVWSQSLTSKAGKVIYAKAPVSYQTIILESYVERQYGKYEVFKGEAGVDSLIYCQSPTNAEDNENTLTEYTEYSPFAVPVMYSFESTRQCLRITKYMIDKFNKKPGSRFSFKIEMSRNMIVDVKEL